MTDYVEPEYKANTRDHKINLGWHVIGGVEGNDTLEAAVSQTKGLNVISPTWFTLTGNEGEFSSFATTSYVERAHEMGLEVWALVGNVDSVDVDMYTVLGKTSNRRRLILQLLAAAREYNLDGLNIDFENISLDAGEPFVQFYQGTFHPLQKYGIVLSVDNYVPMDHTDHYDRAEQGAVADYVIIMGYDEHFAGGEAGSVASYNYVKEGIEKTLAVVPREKVINAVPFYTRVWTEKDGNTSSSAMGIRDALAWVEENNVELYWQEELGQYYGELNTEEGLKQIWMEEEVSLGLKMDLIRENDLAGVGCWKLGFEPASIWDVVKVNK